MPRTGTYPRRARRLRPGGEPESPGTSPGHPALLQTLRRHGQLLSELALRYEVPTQDTAGPTPGGVIHSPQDVHRLSWPRNRNPCSRNNSGRCCWTPKTGCGASR